MTKGSPASLFLAQTVTLIDRTKPPIRSILWSVRKRLRSASTIPDPEGAETAHWLNLFLIVFGITIFVLGIALPLALNPNSIDLSLLLTCIISLTVTTGALFLLGHGYVKATAHLTMCLLFALVTYAISRVFDDFHNPSLLAYFVLIPLAGLLLGKQSMLRFAILCMISVDIIFYLELTGIVTPVAKVHSNWEAIFVWSIAVVCNTILLTVMLRRSEANGQAAHQAVTALVGVNQELQKSQVQLQQALAKEHELGELKSRFVSMASHEIRTPLTTILLLVETLRAYRHKLTDAQIEQRLDRMQEQVGYLQDIMEDMLQLAQLKMRRAQFNPVQFDLNALCLTIIEEIQLQPQMTHRLLYNRDESLSELTLDKRLMRQIIMNLVSNAIKYSANDKPVIVTLMHTEEAVILQVRDAGIGIPEADLKYLFQPFHRAANVGAIAGNGLGLAIVKESIELHGGAISVESQVGVGTTFTATILIPTIPRSV